VGGKVYDPVGEPRN